MGKTVIVLAVLVATTGCVGWTRRDTLTEFAALGVTAIDWRQTEDITRNCQEENPIIGPCGQRAPVGAYFPVMMLAHAAVAAALPHGWWRTSWQVLLVGTETETVWLNQRNGHLILP